MRWVRGTAAVVTVALSAVLGTGTADAGLLGSVVTKTTGVVGQTTQTVTQTATTATNLTGAIADGVQTGASGATSGSNLTKVLEGVTCPPLTQVQQYVKTTGLNPIVSGVTTLACSASLLQYEFRTTYKRADGTMLDRQKSAVLGVPTLLDVDGDGSTDLTGTISFTGLNSVGLKIDRAAGAAAKAAQVQAVLSDTSSKLLGKDRLSFGYDARMASSPGGFQISAPVDKLLGGSPEYQLDITQTNPGSKIALVGAFYDGTPDARVNPVDLRLTYGASPTKASVRAKFGDPISATLTTDKPGPADLLAKIVDGDRSDEITASIQDLPTSLGVDVRTGGQLSATYTAAARVARLTAAITRTRATRIDQKAILDLTDVPTGLQVTQDEDGGSVTTTGGPIGLTKVGVANGEPKFLSGEPAYAYVTDDGTLRSTSVQLPGLQRATFALGAVPALSATLQATPLRVLLDRPAQRIDARLLNLPRQVDLSLDLGNGALRYDGHGDGIGKVTIDGRQSTPFFGRATYLTGTIEQIPAQLDLGLAQGTDGRFAVTASNAIGRIELAAANRPVTAADAIDGTHQGVRYTDTASSYVLAARVLQLKRLAAGLGDTVDVEAQTAGGFFTADVTTDDLTAQARIADLPPVARITANTGQGRLGFSGKDATGRPTGIDRLDLSLASPGGIVGRATNLAGHIEGIPAELTLDIAQDGAGAKIVASAPIQLVELSARNGALTGTELPAGTEQGIRYVDVTGGDYVLGARIRRLERLEASLGTPLRVLANTAGGPFSLGVRTAGLRATGRIEDLPQRLLATVDLDAGKVTLDGKDDAGRVQGIGRIVLDAASRTPLVGRATDLHAELRDIAGDLTVDLAQSGDGVAITANRPVGRVEVVARNGAIADPAADLPVNDEQGVKLTDRAGGAFVLAARIKRFQRAAASFGDTITLGTTTASGPFGVRVDTDDLSGLARIEDLPAVFDASLDLAGGKIALRGRDEGGSPTGIGRLTADLSSARALFGRATDVHANVEGIPADLLLDIAQGGDGAKVAASDTIDRLELVAANHDLQADDLPAGDEQGAKLVDLTRGEFAIGARLKNFRSIEGRFGDQVKIATRTASGPFGVRYITDDLRALARIADLPAQLDATFDLAQGRVSLLGKDADGSDAGPISAVDVALTGRRAVFGRATDLDAHLADVPSTLDLSLAQTGNGVAITSTPAIGLVEVVAKEGAIDREADLPAGGEQGASYVDTDGAYLVSARVKDLSKVVATLGDAVHLEARTAGGPFRVSARTGDLDAKVRFADLPSEVSADFDPAAGRFRYEGSSAVDLATIDVAGVGGRAVIGRATRLNATIKHLAPSVDLTIDPDGPRADVNASEPIEELSVLATDAADAAAVPQLGDGEQGAILRDVDGEPYVLRARLYDLKKIAFGLGGENLGIEAQVRSTVFSVDAKTAALNATARIDKLPANTKLSFDLAAGKVSYQGRTADGDGAGIDELSFSAQSADALFGRARVLRGTLTDIPPDLSVGFDPGAGGAKVTLPDGTALGGLELLASDVAGQAFPFADQGVTFIDRPGRFLVAARILGLKGLDVGLGDSVGLKIDRTDGSPFRAEVDADGVLTASADIQDLPASAELAIDLAGTDTNNPNALRFKGRDKDGNPVGIGRFDLKATVDEAILGGGTYLQGHIEDLPSDVAISFSQENGQASVRAIDPARPDATDGPKVGLIELAASDTAEQFEYPTSNGQPAQGAILRSKSGDPFRIGIRVRQLQNLTVAFGKAVRLTARTEGGPFVADVATDAFSAKAQILDLPKVVDLNLDLDAGEVTYDGSAGIGRLYAEITGDEPLFLGANAVEVDLKQVPTSFTLGLAQGMPPGGTENADLNGIRLEANNPIGQIDVRARSTGRDYPEIPAGQAGAILDSTSADPDAQKIALALRVFKLKLLDVSLDPVSLQAEMESGRTFTVDAKIPQKDEATGAAKPNLEIAGVIDQLPAKVKLSLTDLVENGTPNGSQLALEGSAPISFVSLSTKGLQLLEGADTVKAEIENLPEKLTVALPETGDLARIESRNAAGALTPVGQLRLAAGGSGATLPADDYTNGQAGSLNDLLTFKQGDQVDIKARVTGIKSVALNLEPVSLQAETVGGKKLDIDAQVPLTDGAPPTSVKALIDALPSSLTLALGDNPALLPNGQPNGTQLKVSGNTRIPLVTLDVSGLELLPGASVIKGSIHDLPQSTTITIPEEGTLARIEGKTSAGAADAIGQLRLSASDGSLALPAYVDPSTAIPGTVTQATASNDLLKFNQDPANFGVALRLTGAKVIDVDLDPVALNLQQDAAKARPVTIDAKIPSGSTISDVKGLINRPGTKTTMQVNLSNNPSVPSSIEFDNSQKLARLELYATNLGSIPSAKLAFDNVAPRLTACLDPGNGCRRTNPNVPGNTTTSPKGCTGGNIFNPCSGPPQDKRGNRYNANGNGRPYPAQASLNFNDRGSLGTGTADADFTTFRAKLKLSPTQPEIAFGDPDTNSGGLTFKSFGLDLGTEPTGGTISSFGQNLPMLYMFFDSKSDTGAVQPFAMQQVKYPPLVANFNVGTTSNKANANARFVWARGDGSLVTSPTSTATGSMNCGGAKELSISTSLGNINALNVLGLGFALLPVC